MAYTIVKSDGTVTYYTNLNGTIINQYYTKVSSV